jgi:signal transduction histidine kinase
MVELALHEFDPLYPLLTVSVGSELDVIASRLRARQIATLCGFGSHEQTRVATAVSELARNAFAYAASGKVRFFIGKSGRRQALVITIDDKGTGIPHLGALLAEDPDAPAGGGGILAARRFMDCCEIVSDKRGTCIVLAKSFPAHVPHMSVDDIGGAIARLDALPGNVALSEATQQNRELTDALAALQAKQQELIEVSENLERTNRQVEALNVLLNEKANSLMSADRRKDEFLSVLSHELRGPLSAAAMAAQLLENNPDKDRQGVKLGQIITRQVGHMSRLVEDLLDVSRVSRGLVSITKTAVDMREVVEAASEQLAPAAHDKGHRVMLTLPAQPCIVDGDRTRLLQVVANLLGNAIRYTPAHGRIDVGMAVQGDQLVVCVADNGIGIPAALMPHLFDLYTQAERSSDSRNSGLGLGLALVKSLVEAHGGSVCADSGGTGCGSRFEVRLALSAAALALPEVGGRTQYA